MPTATLTSKGQMTIPKVIRDELDLKPGDRVELNVLPDGRVLMTPTVPLASLAGILPKPKRAYTVEDMNTAIVEAVSRKYKRR
ncbi:MAG: AbrB/MazE/SpoVT family DNA-binding domain-containing protein [Dongiaceae bacterium]